MRSIAGQLRHKATIMKGKTVIDEDNRAKYEWEPYKEIFFGELGITTTETYLSAQQKDVVDRRILIRPVDGLTTTDFMVQVDATHHYLITRIYYDPKNDMEELSLSWTGANGKPL